MAEYTEEAFEKALAEIKTAFDDGFQWHDIGAVVKMGMTAAEAFKLEGPEKKKVAIDLMEKLIDVTEIPWLPDTLIDPILKRLLPGFIDLIVDATKGKLDINK